MITTAVLDVNILASAAATKEGLPGLLVDQAVDGMYRLALSEHILKTLRYVLLRPYFAQRLDYEQRNGFLKTGRCRDACRTRSLGQWRL